MSSYVGEHFGRWTVVAISEYRIEGRETWVVECRCGTLKCLRATQLKLGKTRSCVCLARDLSRERRTLHGKSNTPEYRAWSNLKNRCLNENAQEYRYYGGRGIKVCDRWLHSFSSFLADMGKKPGKEYSIERKDVNKGYEPSNCKWATMAEQQNNKRSNVFTTYNGVRYSNIQLGELLGLTPSAINNRIRRGWRPADIVSRSRKRGYGYL